MAAVTAPPARAGAGRTARLAIERSGMVTLSQVPRRLLPSLVSRRPLSGSTSAHTWYERPWGTAGTVNGTDSSCACPGFRAPTATVPRRIGGLGGVVAARSK